MKESRSVSSKGRVLVVDDYEDSAEVMRHLLEALGYEARSCSTGRDALDLVTQLAPTTVLLDILLGDHTGYEIARLLRARPKGRDLHLVAVSGLGRPDDRRRALEAGFDHYMVKPIDLATLVSVVSKRSG